MCSLFSPQGVPTNGTFRSHDCYIFKLFWRLGLLVYPKLASNPKSSHFNLPRARVSGRRHHIQFCVVLRMEARVSCMLDKHSPTERPSETYLKYFGEAWWHAGVGNPSTPKAEAGRLSVQGQSVKTEVNKQTNQNQILPSLPQWPP